ncbi:putative basic proline-rich protein-like [Iris pallida]|uniref:Basic proline-rich protein-like n=1 Tax=Iris pallida TaxID=29817 RepID=A0AAX6F469_IRIPA|nr:putative basic proline-rich protein-like [Iris pallida]
MTRPSGARSSTAATVAVSEFLSPSLHIWRSSTAWEASTHRFSPYQHRLCFPCTVVAPTSRSDYQPSSASV